MSTSVEHPAKARVRSVVPCPKEVARSVWMRSHPSKAERASSRVPPTRVSSTSVRPALPSKADAIVVPGPVATSVRRTTDPGAERVSPPANSSMFTDAPAPRPVMSINRSASHPSNILVASVSPTVSIVAGSTQRAASAPSISRAEASAFAVTTPSICSHPRNMLLADRTPIALFLSSAAGSAETTSRVASSKVRAFFSPWNMESRLPEHTI